ncbi:MAG: DUF2314 domain-containing protein [Alphaproteobacteria bacterium]|nr:DUF2314 domain-containing protein [Alphaproteobacteria bacterium]
MFRFFGTLFVAAGIFSMTMSPVNARDDTVSVRSGDAEMNQAITTARKSLPVFFAMIRKPDVGVAGFALKVGIKDPGVPDYTEHFWLVELQPERGGKFSGVINNDPAKVRNVKIGQRYHFTLNDVSDWMFTRDGKIVGNYTMRPLLKRMPKAQAAQYRAMLEKP